MPTARKKTAVRRVAGVPAVTAQDAFTGIAATHFLKPFLQFGVNGIVAGVMVYAVTVMIPTMMEKHAANLKEAREDGFAHGEKAVERIAKSIDGLRETFDGNQVKVRGNQSESITVQKRMVELLEKQVSPAPN